MENSEIFKKLYLQNAEWIEMSHTEYKEALEGNEKKYYSLKYLSVLIYNDLTREFYNVEINPAIGVPKLLSLKTAILSLFEAHLWYKSEGTKALLEIAEDLGVHQEVRGMLANLKPIKPTNIEKYAIFRNKLSGHYSLESIETLEELKKIPYEQLESDALRVIEYANKWLDILRYVGTKA